MQTDSDPHAAARERLSALMDGELDAAAAAHACAHWAGSGESRSAWHAYHVIGDVLRSEDLASDPARDAGFLGALRARLADEPVVLAPRPLQQAARASAAAVGERAPLARRWGWVVPSAVAAGFVMVVGGLTLTRGPGAPEHRPELAVNAVSRAAVVPAVASAVIATEPQTYVANGQLIRDARLDRYLAAHQQFAGSSVLGVPSAFLRNATADAADR